MHADPDAVLHYREAETYVNGLIFGPPSPPPGTPPEEIRARAVARLERLREFLAFCGNPQRRYRSIHVGGTSGKGSTTALLGRLLQAAGYRTGVHTSPYLQVATEKLAINGEIVAASRYLQLVDSMRRQVERWVAAGHERPNYGEFWVAMTFQYFAEEQVDVAVIEVGAGGRFDVTNVIEPDVAVITSIGYDHMVTLGNTLPEIAWHKAGIIKPGSVAATTVDVPEALDVIVAEARKVGAPLEILRAGDAWRDVCTTHEGTEFLDARSNERFTVPLLGAFQAANGALAIAAARAFAGARITSDVIRRGFAATRFPGRIEVVQLQPLVILDGAHNPDKMRSLLASLDQLYPDRNLVVVFGVLESKSHIDMLDILAPKVATLVATAPSVIAKPPVPAAMLAERARTLLSNVRVADDPLDAVEIAIQCAGPDDLVLVTGSLYLIGNVRERWYPTEHILSQGTSWPAPP